MTDTPEFPALHPDLYPALNARFPDKCPAIGDTEREIWMKAGERRLVEWLKAKQELQ